ncbi:MAG: histidine phosphatase family protein [Burkholderiaceae bacterium]
MNTAAALAVWRHPRPSDVQGRCIGRTDVRVDRRKAKRLAHRIRRWARQHGAARVVLTSSLQRAASVGRVLAGWGWQHHIDARLNEMDFGEWDGLAWETIGADAVGDWCEAFAEHAPGGGESVAQLLARCGDLMAELHAAAAPPCVVGHAGWISAAQWLQAGSSHAPSAAEWPGAISYSTRVLLACSGP